MAFRRDTALALDLPATLDGCTEARIAASFEGRMAGIDEAGRGPWAGPVACAAVILDYANLPEGLADSKTLKQEARDRLFTAILASAHVGITFSGPTTIDRINIRAATLTAMANAAYALDVRPAACLIDGRDVPPGLPCPGQAAIKGDARLLCVAAASIIAKVARDRLMIRMSTTWPAYGFAAHKGYGTAMHGDALARSGPCPLHRQSFRPVAASRVAPLDGE